MNNLNNQKYFSILGDSISTLDGYCPIEYEVFYKVEKCYKAQIYSPQDTWWGQVLDALGGKLLVNNSWSGSMACKHPQCGIPSYGASDERTAGLGKDGVAPDVIMVYLGTNDWGAGMIVDSDAGEEDNLAVFRVAYRTMLDKIKQNYPDAEIWCFTLGVSRCTRNPDFAFPYRYAGRHIEEYCTVIRDCAKDNGCMLIDLYDETKQDPFDTIDGFHPNAEGMKRISTVVINHIDKS